MIDVQSQPDGRKIEIDKVGVKGLRYPIVVLDRRNREQSTVARVNMYVRLPHRFRGTHMSRFLEILNEVRGRISIKNMQGILHTMQRALDSEEAHLELRFPYFIEKEAPVSRSKSLMEYTSLFAASVREGEGMDFVLGVDVPVHTLCPCSKEISDFGGHNQRSMVRVRVRFRDFVWIEDLVELVERSGSAAIYPLLKRSDEKYVTEQAYQNPCFVEDVVRNAAGSLEGMPEVTWFSVESENEESIHSHAAYAYLERERVEGPDGAFRSPSGRARIKNTL